MRRLLSLLLVTWALAICCPSASAQTRDEIVQIVAALIDPQKLATLNVQQRSINERFKKLLYYLYVAESKGHKLEDVVGAAYDIDGVGEMRRLLTVPMLRGNFDAVLAAQVFSTDANLEALRRGQSPRLTFGNYAGELAEVDHIVPISRHPEFGNDLANLQLIAKSVNLAKSDTMGPAEMEHLVRLQTVAAAEREGQQREMAKAMQQRAEEARRLTTLQLLSRDYNFALPPRWSRIGNEVLFDGKTIVPDLQGETKRRGLSEDALIDQAARAARAQVFTAPKEGVHWRFVRDPRLRGYPEDVVKGFYAVILGRSFDDDLEKERARSKSPVLEKVPR